MKKIIFTAIICTISILAYSQSNTKSEKVRELLELMGSGDLAKQVMNQMISLFKDAYSDVDSQFWDEFSKELNVDDLIDLTIPIYEKYYTENEIEQLIKFYKTPLGRKVTANLPLITQESMEAGRVWGEGVGMKVIERLREKGYIKD